jgi:ABC-type microcin C transport system duplicated ATPase subunit YejF
MDTSSRSGGEIRIRGQRIDGLSRREMRTYRREPVVFQYPYFSLNPHLRVRDIIDEPLARQSRRAHRSADDGRSSRLHRDHHLMDIAADHHLGQDRALAPDAQEPHPVGKLFSTQ